MTFIWIIFDFDDVVSHKRKWFRSILEQANRSVEFDVESALKYLREKQDEWLSGKMSTPEVVEGFSKRVGTEVSYDIIKTAMEDSILPEQEVLDIIASLREKDYKICMLTDNPTDRIEMILVREDVAPLFDRITGSGYLGIMKDEPVVFIKLAKQLGISPEEALFIDDNESNCLNAQAAGMSALHFKLSEESDDNGERLLKGLKSFGIEF